MSTKFRKTLVFAAAAAMLAGVVGTASAETHWQKSHPRRNQVNHRLHHQNHRIHRDVRNGTMNGGHITRPEQRVLNQQENGISSRIAPK
jgi:hypothetical protein